MGIRQYLKTEIYSKRIRRMTMSEIRIEHLRKSGVTIGDHCFIFSDNLETTEPYLVTIGNNVTIAAGVVFITHDDSAEYYASRGNLAVGRVTIGNDVFIGNGSIILPGITIADGCIIGAGSVVTRSILKEKSVVGGVPAKVIEDSEKLSLKNRERLFFTANLSFEEKKKMILQHPEKFIQR